MNPYLQALHKSFQENASRACLEVGGESLSYQRVKELTDSFAIQLGDSVEQKPVALSMKKSLEFYLGQLAILQAGGFFVPIDPNYPKERRRLIWEDSQSELVLVNDKSADFLSETQDQRELRLDWKSPLARKENKPKTNSKLGENPLAYMIYTSGSTGRPKGVPITSEGLLNHNRWFIEEFSLKPQDRVLQFASLSFDISIEEIFPTYLAGATLVAMEESALASTADFLAFIEKKKISVLNLPTAFWHMLVSELSESSSFPSCVRLLIVGGEPVSPERLKQWFQLGLEELPLYNGYGPTEATITSSVSRLRKEGTVEIGKAILGLTYAVYDTENSCLIEEGEGELLITGSGVTPGYWNRPELNETQFPVIDGRRYYRTGDQVEKQGEDQFFFKGRIDEQVKIRGFRIEPQEISEQLELHESIEQAFVRVHEIHGRPQLVAYYLAKGTEVSLDTLREFLNQRLPSHMVPPFLLELSEIHQTAGKKVDFASFPKPIVAALSAQEIADETQQKLALIWKDLLQLDNTPLEVSFFELGGDSLLAMQLMGRIQQEFPGVRIPLSQLMIQNTVVALASVIDETRAQDYSHDEFEGKPKITSLNQDSNEVPIVSFHGADGTGIYYQSFESALPKRHPFHIVESGLLLQDEVSELPQKTIQEIADCYMDELRPLIKGDQVVLVGYSLGGILAFEVACRLQKEGSEVAKLINLDAAVPSQVRTSTLSEMLSKLQSYCRRPRTLRHKTKHSLKRVLMECKLRTQKQPSLTERSHQVMKLYNGLEDNYEPQQTFTGNMVLIRSKELEFKLTLPEDYGWKRYITGEIITTTVEGSHLSMLKKERLRGLLSVFTEACSN